MTQSTAYGPALALAATLSTLGVLELGAHAIAPPAAPHTAMFRPAAGSRGTGIDALRDHDRVGLYLFPADHHPSARGHARIAEITVRSLIARKILPSHRKAITGSSDVGEPPRRVES